MVNPLQNLTTTDVQFVWSGVHDETLQKAKAPVVEAPCFAYFDPKKPIVFWLQRYDISVFYNKGSSLVLADTLSRAPYLLQIMESRITLMCSGWKLSDLKLCLIHSFYQRHPQIYKLQHRKIPIWFSWRK